MVGLSLWILVREYEIFCLKLAVNLDTMLSSQAPMLGQKLVSSCFGESHYKLKVNIYR